MEEEQPERVRRSKIGLGGLLAFVFFAGLTISYYIVHKPFSPTLALSLAVAWGRLFIVALLICAAGGLGQRLLPALSIQPLARLALQAALGLGAIALGVLALGVLGLLRPWLGWVALAGLLLGLRRPIAAWLSDWRSLGLAWRQASRMGKFLAVCIAAILLSTLLSSLGPPIRFDALTYHLALPRLYLQAGRFFYIPQNIYWGMPQTAEMLYTFAMALGGLPTAAVLGWASGALALLGMLGLALERFAADAAWVAAAALVSGYTLASALSWAYVDWLVLLFGVCWLAALTAWVEQRERGYLLLAGLLAGLAVGAKYTAGILLIGGAVALLFYKWSSLRQTLEGLLVYGLTAGLAAAPWLLKNLLATGNPLYPFLFPAGAMSELRLALYQGGRPFGGWQDVFLLPLRATFVGVEGGPGYSASIGPLLFGLSLSAGVGWGFRPKRQKEAIRLAALVALVGVLTWMALGRFSSYLLQSRLYFAFFPALAFLAAAGFSALERVHIPGVRLGRIVAFLIALVLGLNVLEVGVHTLQQRSLDYVLGVKAEADYLADNLGWYAPAMEAVRQLPSDQRALLLWEPRSLYCLPRCDPDEVLDRWKRQRYPVPGAAPAANAAILAEWRAAGYTHLLYHRSGADFIRQEGRLAYTTEDWQALNEMIAALRPIQDFGGAYILYSLMP